MTTIIVYKHYHIITVTKSCSFSCLFSWVYIAHSGKQLFIVCNLIGKCLLLYNVEYTIIFTSVTMRERERERVLALSHQTFECNLCTHAWKLIHQKLYPMIERRWSTCIEVERNSLMTERPVIINTIKIGLIYVYFNIHAQYMYTIYFNNT